MRRGTPSSTQILAIRSAPSTFTSPNLKFLCDDFDKFRYLFKDIDKYYLLGFIIPSNEVKNGIRMPHTLCNLLFITNIPFLLHGSKFHMNLLSIHKAYHSDDLPQITHWLKNSGFIFIAVCNDDSCPKFTCGSKHRKILA